jgi:BirA family biotin operon repressor/biotin-[acetyl-CoA-carboxylase] ligase
MPISPKNFIVLHSIDSTNNYAMALVKKGQANSGDVIFAKDQTAGKGRMGKLWESKTGENIILSLLQEIQWLPVQMQFRLSIAVSLGCLDFFSRLIKENIKIKWPNDIYINDRKAGGILIENIIKGSLWQWAVIGIGLNINQVDFETSLFNANSLKKLTGRNYDVIELAKDLSKDVLNRIEKLKSGDFNKMLDEYNRNLFCRDKFVRLKKGNIVFETRIVRVSETGELITSDVIERSFSTDEISLQSIK